ncbi:MAG: hypothetical protein IPP04_04835 [Saprospiraceae bacterium]|nr:hypothetical protein [Saprospiraceae bacterium]MBL0109477.1 hypothetical protein [Saprospiraceae bacterium]
MTVNFEIEDNYALTYLGQHIDLHNNYDLVGYDYKIVDRQLVLTWTKSLGDWTKESDFARLTLIHSNVFFLKIGYDNKENEFPNDDKCLGGISYFPSTDRETNDGLISQGKPNDEDDIIYIFETDHFIRIGCDDIKLLV